MSPGRRRRKGAHRLPQARVWRGRRCRPGGADFGKAAPFPISPRNTSSLAGSASARVPHSSPPSGEITGSSPSRRSSRARQSISAAEPLGIWRGCDRRGQALRSGKGDRLPPWSAPARLSAPTRLPATPLVFGQQRIGVGRHELDIDARSDAAPHVDVPTVPAAPAQPKMPVSAPTPTEPPAPKPLPLMNERGTDHALRQQIAGAGAHRASLITRLPVDPPTGQEHRAGTGHSRAGC
jgi:hypothetical protein